MVPVNESKRKEHIQALHAKLWDKLQDRDETYVEQWLQSRIDELEPQPDAKALERLKSIVRDKWFWVAVIVGCTIVPVSFYLFVLAALAVE